MAIFAGTAFIMTREISRALDATQEGRDLPLPGEIGAFIGTSVLTVLALGLWLAIDRSIRWLRKVPN